MVHGCYAACTLHIGTLEYEHIDCHFDSDRATKGLLLKSWCCCRMDNSIVENQTHLKTLTEGIHSKEALQLVREHVLGVMGPASMAYSSSMIKMAKLQVCLLAGSQKLADCFCLLHG